MSSATQKNTSHLRTVTQIAFLSAIAASFALGCVSSNSDNKATGGTIGTEGGAAGPTGGAIASSGGTTGSGNTGSGGSSSVGGAAAGALATATKCATPTTPLLTDFTYTPTDAAVVPTEASFGNFTTTFSGGTYIYPDASVVPTPAFPLTSNITASNWHISGTVGTYSGLGLYWNACALLDASAFKGISMTISGSVPAPNTLSLSVSTAEDTISTEWYAKYTVPPATYSPTFGTCAPPGNNQYDGTCTAPSKAIPVTATPTKVTILWADLILGKPQASVTPSKLTGISFYFTWSGTAVAYPVDITIDDLSFIP
jgi:hypothetical protein